ncbi:MAG: hypothetical protein IPP61_06965 [Cytophagaceae bacterium]|nr:hypothetical protein [Cytophagaceae bacterium]
MKLLYYFLPFLFLFSSCEKDIDVNKQFELTKDKQTRFILSVEGKDFYEEDAVFSGHLEAKENYFVMNFLNQNGGNFILNLSGNGWYNEKFIEGRIYGAASSNLMFGRVVDAKINKGEGYLFSSGKIEPLSVSKSKLIFKLTGEAKKYPNVSETDPSYSIEGLIISKNPEFQEFSITNSK